eukprot:CAMPEP_0168335870 /NCGR_PEP_ID=MMETSP0213-20121227/11181_1 /TAXON_ID=151035 /ORGANISM="Euplotes harpa, Strain FSP1.4" /LENGTH=58 /DNA_ID=CAMNT_0008340909 /DNA_START=25 /DNA_END=197 /DNA_ORIENTATION=+
MEVRKLKKTSKNLSHLLEKETETKNVFNFDKRTIDMVKKTIKKMHIEDLERIKLLAPL